MKLSITDLSPLQVQYYLQHLVAPRPICFASTIDRKGCVNLSPFSFFNLFSSSPPIVIFSAARRLRDNTTKHTLENIREVPEVVINIVSYEMVQQTSLASCDYPKGVDEFIKAGFTKEPAAQVRPPMVKESKAKLECKVNEIKSLGENAGAGQLIIAEVLCIHIADDLMEGEVFQQHELDLVARLGGDWYARVTADNLFKVAKPNTKTGIGFDALPTHILNSPVLAGNDLAQLANSEHLPAKDEQFNDNHFLELCSAGSDTSIFHLYAKELIRGGDVNKAWQVLLHTNV